MRSLLSQNAMNRRQLFVLGTGGIAAAWLPLPEASLAAEAEAAAPAHFFLEVLFPGGMDCLYTFDARPLAMTQAGLLVNHMQEEPEVLTGANSNSTLATKLVAPLKPHLDRFSVLNGVLMSTGFDGHDNNMNYLLAGNPFGGESLLPHLNQGDDATPIDYVSAGGTAFAVVTNTSNSVPLTPESASALAGRLANLPALTPGSPVMAYLASRMQASGAGSGRFAAGARAMTAGFAKVPRLSESLKTLATADAGSDPVLKLAQMIGGLFKNKLCKSVQLVIDGSVIKNMVLDTHDPQSAAQSPAVIGQCMEALATLIKHLRETPYDDKNSLLDVTTVLAGTEFGRTTRQTFAADVANSGTDHNPLKNTFVIGGKGIKGGMIGGGTDYQAAGEVLSGVHKSFDAEQVKFMGRPLDFATLRPAQALPDVYRSGDYLDFACIANTIYQLFGAPSSRLRTIDRNGPAAQVLSALLA